jgi:hypothetical protein
LLTWVTRVELRARTWDKVMGYWQHVREHIGNLKEWMFLAKNGISDGKNVSNAEFPEAWLFSIEIAKLLYKDGSG